jgi:hypothetical protein
MKKIDSLLIGLLFTGSAFAQNEFVKYTITVPKIDGFIEYDWDIAEPIPIAKNFRDEKPTVTATWQALYDNDNFYVVVMVEDDDHWPGWEAMDDSWLYDKPEVYWDVNEVLTDGGGAGTSPGHWQLADGFTDGMYDTPITKAGGASINPGGTYAYSLVGEGYVYEMAVPWKNLKDNTGAAYVPKCGGQFGFDVTIIDQDEGITTSRQRAVWMNDGIVDENWNNMDGAGLITLISRGCEFTLNLSFSSNTVTLLSKEGSSDSITVNSNQKWTAVSDQSWLVVSPTSHTGDGTLTFTASANSGASRIATVSFTGWNNYTITITQLAGGVGISKMDSEKIRTYPNPVTDRITIQGGIDRIELFNSLGIKVKETEIKSGTFSVGELSVGIYLLKAYKNGDFAGVAKIFKN